MITNQQRQLHCARQDTKRTSFGTCHNSEWQRLNDHIPYMDATKGINETFS